MKTKLVLSNIETAAIMQELFNEGPKCDRLVCDGFAQYLDDIKKDGCGNALQPGRKATQQEELSGKVGQRIRRDVARKIADAADRIGISIAHASTEPAGSPRNLEQRELLVEELAAAWRDPSPYRQWEVRGRAADDADKEAINRGAALHGKKPGHCHVEESKFEAIRDEIIEDEAMSDRPISLRSSSAASCIDIGQLGPLSTPTADDDDEDVFPSATRKPPRPKRKSEKKAHKNARKDSSEGTIEAFAEDAKPEFQSDGIPRASRASTKRKMLTVLSDSEEDARDAPQLSSGNGRLANGPISKGPVKRKPSRSSSIGSNIIVAHPSRPAVSISGGR